MPKIENNEENDTSATRVTRSLRKRLPVNDTDSPKKNTKSSVAKMSKEAEKDLEKDTTMSETRKTRASRSDSPLTTKPDENVPRTPARRLTRRASATEDLVTVSTPTRRSRRISHDDVNILKASVDKPITRSRRTPVPISEEVEPVEREEAASPGVRTRSMTVSPYPQMSSRRNSRPERCKTPSEVEKTSKKKDETGNVSKEDDLLNKIDESKEPVAKEETRNDKKSDQETSPKVEEKTENKSQEKDKNMESLEDESKSEVSSHKEKEVINDSTKDKTDESDKSPKLESSSTLDENETTPCTSKEAFSKQKEKVSKVDKSELAKDEGQSETPQPIKSVSFHASTQEQEKSPSRFPKTPILSKSRSYFDKNVAKKGNLSEEGKVLSENFCMDTSDIPVEVNPSSTETPKLGLKRCLSAMTSSTPIDSVKNEKALKNAKLEKLQEIGSILPDTPDEDVTMEEKFDVRDETPSVHSHEEPKPDNSKSETTEVKIPKRSINFEAEGSQETVKASETDAMDVVHEVDEDVTKGKDEKKDKSSTVEVSEDILNPKDMSKEKEHEQKTSPAKTRTETEDPKDVANTSTVDKEASSAKTRNETEDSTDVTSTSIVEKEASLTTIANENNVVPDDVTNSTDLNKEKGNNQEASVKVSDEKEASKDVAGSSAVDKENEDKQEASTSKIVDDKANESDSNEMVIDANDDDTVEMDALMLSKKTPLETKEKGDKPETSIQMRQTEEKTDSKEESSSTSAVQDELKKGSPFSKSWSHAVKGTPALDGKNFIDGLGVLDKKEEEIIHSTKKPGKASLPSQKDDEDEDLEGEEEYYEEEEEEEEKNEFIDDEAEENSQDSMDSSEREYLRQNEIPEEGESIGSDDTESIAEDEDDGEEEEEEENASFIVSDEEEAQFSVDTDEDDFLLTKKNKNKKKERKRIRQLDESTDEEDENADKLKNDVDITEKTEDALKDGADEVLKEGDGAKDSETNDEERSKENPVAVEDEIPSTQNEAVEEETDQNASQAVSSTETKKAENETSHNVDKNVNTSEDISKNRNESSAEMESTTPFDASVLEKRNLPVRMEEETVEYVSPSQESGTMERLCVDSETAGNEDGTNTQEGPVSNVPEEVESEGVSGKKTSNVSSGSNSSADDERSGNEQVKTKKIENQKKMKVSKEQEEKSDGSSDSETMVFTSTLLAPFVSKKKDLKTIDDKTHDSVEIQDENSNDKQISNKKKKKRKETSDSTQIEAASSSKSKNTAPETVETTQTEVSDNTVPSAKQDKKKRTRSVEDASKYDSILLRCEQILRTQEEVKKKARLENKPKKVKKNKKQKVNEETNVLESKNHEVVQTAPKLKQSLDEPKSKNLNVIEQNSDDNYQEEEDAVEASSSKMSHEPKVKRKRASIDNSLEEKAPKKKKRLNILKIVSSSGAFKEEPLTPKGKQAHGFIESDIQMPTTIGKKVKSLMKSDEVEYTRKKTKKIKRKLEVTEPITLLPKPKWTSSGEFAVTKLPNTENSSKILKQIGSATEFYVEPLKVKKRKLDADVEHRAMEFKKSALYNNDRIKRESSKQLLQRKKRQEVYNNF